MWWYSERLASRHWNWEHWTLGLHSHLRRRHLCRHWLASLKRTSLIRVWNLSWLLLLVISWVSVVVISLATYLSCEVLLSLHVSNKRLNQGHDFWSLDVVQGQWIGVILSVVQIVSFLFHFLNLNFSDFFDLVEVDGELLAVESRG